ncbi:MarR family winged helix-turn-helix transcriptional regulator [Kribbella yunnanensis]|uniref:MarR family winged helix-turn-helix transcriptional regulator n=2 Tax=Kribbella yunnanensis TaxID=190194 RepID=A0ABP4UZ47_9ACTN
MPSRSQEPLDAEDLLLWRSLGRLVQRLPRALDNAMLRTSGLTMTEFSVLEALADADDHAMRVTDLAREVGLSHSRVSRVIDDLAARGWCGRSRDAQDGRAALALLTEAGEAEAKKAGEHHLRLARERVLAHVRPEDRAVLIAALSAIADSNET